MSRVVGLDLSLTGTGVCVLGGDPGDLLTTITSKGSKDATLSQRAVRLAVLRDRILSYVQPTDVVVVEGPSFGHARQGGQHDRAGLWWIVVDAVLELGATVIEVAPASRAKYATGKGNAAKDAVLAAVIRRYPDHLVANNNEADALVLAAIGARHLGEPIDELPLTHLAAMDAVHWPEVAA